MHHRVFLAAAAPEIGQDGRHVGLLQQQGEVVHDPGQPLVQAGAGDVPEQLAQEGRGVGEGGRLAAEGTGGGIVQAAGGEQAIGGGLGLQIGEIARRKVADQHLAIGGQQIAQRPLPLVRAQDRPDSFAQQAGFGRHAPGQIAGIGDGGPGGGEKGGEQRDQPGGAVLFHGQPPAPVEPGQADALAPLAPRIAAKRELVGQDQVGQGIAIAPQLRRGFGAVEVGADVLAFDMAQRRAALLGDEVGRPAGRPRRFVDDLDGPAAQGHDQAGERRAIAVLGGPAAGPQPPHIAEIVTHRAPRAVHGKPPAQPP